MSRLLFAAARKARIERLMSDLIWCVTNNVPMTMARNNYRIHPDDAHLAYGPISTALREKATQAFIGTEFSQDVLSYMDTRPRIPASEYWDWLDAKELHRSLFLLILAESLADEGL